MTALPAGGDAGLPRQFIRSCLALLVAEGPAHGYELVDRVGQLGIRSADAGFVYRTLRAMEADRHVISSWQESPAGPARRTYRLTVEGGVWLRRSADALAHTRGCLSTYLQRAQRLTEPEQGRRTA